MRLPVLVHHFIEHVELDNSTLVEFLVEHYKETINHADDVHHDHERLPFKTVDCNSSLVTSILPPINSSISQLIPESIEGLRPTYSQQNYSNNVLKSVWQPPRLS